MTLYMAVTADKYELPCMVSEVGQEMARAYGIPNSNFYIYIQRGSVRKCDGVKFLRIEV